MATTAPKIKLNPGQAMANHQARSNQAAEDRFAAASTIIAKQPTGLAPSVLPDHQLTPSAPLRSREPLPFDLDACVVGSTVAVPLHLIDVNPLSPRQVYLDENVNVIAETITDGQDDDAHGYIDGGRVKLIDGGTRYRAARITDRPTLNVKLEPAPKSLLDLFNRARALNEQRSQPTALDFALSLKLLLDQGAVASQRELIEKVKAPGGGVLKESLVSTYMRVNKLPPRIQRAMSTSPETNSLAALYAVSELFPDGQSEEEQEAAESAAAEIIEDINRRKLSRKQIQDLVAAKLTGPKSRERSTVHRLEIGKHTGQIKTFHRKGEIQLSLKGLGESQMPGLKAALQKAVEEFLSSGA